MINISLSNAETDILIEILKNEITDLELRQKDDQLAVENIKKNINSNTKSLLEAIIVNMDNRMTTIKLITKILTTLSRK